MTKEQLYEKHGVLILSEVSFIEDLFPNYPIFRKVELIMRGNNFPEKKVYDALVDYQHFMEN